MKIAAPSMISMLSLLCWLTPLLGQEKDLKGERVSELMRKGEDAMSARLWEVARHHYQSLLQQANLDETYRQEATMRLVEAMIREGLSQEALALLEQSFLKDHPETSFWKGQALATNGLFTQAVDALKSRIGPEAAQNLPHRLEAGLSASSLELALDKPQEALKTLSITSAGMDGADLQRIRLKQISILIDLKRIDEARELLPAFEQVHPKLQSSHTFTEAAILLHEGQHEEAARKYQDLVENPQELTLRQHHESWIGWADALLAQDKRNEAAELLLDYVEKHPESNQLEKIFERLLSALPKEPTSNDPILAHVQAWIKPTDLPELGLIPNRRAFAVSAWPQISELNDLNAFACYTMAIGLHRQNTPASRRQAEILLKRLSLEAPTHFLSNRSLLMRARWHLEANEEQKAHHLLSVLRETATSPLIKGQAAFYQAQAITDTESEPVKAIELYQQAASLLQNIEADTARFNGLLLHTVQAGSTHEEIQALDIEDAVLAASLQLERAIAKKDPTHRQIAIESFLLEHPKHPRAAEARINAAESALQSDPKDLSSARAQIEALEADTQNLTSIDPARLALTKLRILDLEGASEEAIASARALIESFPASPQAIEASFILGYTLYQTRNYNEARIVLEKLTTELNDLNRIQTAWLLAAHSAALIPTSQSQQEALGLFDKAIETKGPLQDLARLEKARLMIDMNQLEEAITHLRAWFQKLDDDSPMWLASGLLLGEAIYAQGKLNTDSLPQALSIYDELLTSVERFSPEYDRLQYLRGLTLEQLPDPQMPGQNQDKEALVAYYSVLERDQVPSQWEYFEAAGFRALSLLEEARRWSAAIACAKKIASFKGPRSEEAEARANTLQLKHMIWED